MVPVNFKPAGDWFIKETSRNRDTLTYWITDTLVASQDTLKLKLTYLTTDSTGQFVGRSDTVNMRFQAAIARTGSGRRPKAAAFADVIKTVPLTGNISNRGNLDINKTIFFTADKPLQSVHAEGLELYKIVDTLLFKQQVTCYQDTVLIRKFRLESKWEEDSQYKLLLKPGTVFDIYGLTNDSLEVSFVTQKADFYCRILLTIGGGEYPMLVQILDAKGMVIDAKHIEMPGLTVFDYLKPGKYSLKAIFDKNRNGKWDTGNYLKHIQPESIVLHNITDQLRSSWDYEISWNIME
jgi:hypothetical protein